MLLYIEYKGLITQVWCKIPKHIVSRVCLGWSLLWSLQFGYKVKKNKVLVVEYDQEDVQIIDKTSESNVVYEETNKG